MTEFLVTCEHGGNQLPEPYSYLRPILSSLLPTHRGWDPGALEMSRAFSDYLGARLIYSRVTRLLVDLNRSANNRRALIHPLVREALSSTEIADLISRYHSPHRESVAEHVAQSLSTGALVHIGVHSFTQILDGVSRTADLGILYDPAFPAESDYAREWRGEILRRWPDFTVRLNYPYRGSADGLTTSLRRRFGKAGYLGIELELNQGLVAGDFWNQLLKELPATVPVP